MNFPLGYRRGWCGGLKKRPKLFSSAYMYVSDGNLSKEMDTMTMKKF